MDEETKHKKIKLIPDYQKVMEHLEKKHFALEPYLNQQEKYSIKIPKNFSISEEPDKSIILFRQIYTIGKNICIKELELDYSECNYLGLSASTITDIIILVSGKYRKEMKSKLGLTGIYPKNQMAQNVFSASGLPHHLNIEKNYIRKNIERFETRSGVYDQKKRKSGTIATELTEYFDKCLWHQEMELREEGKVFLATLLGEVLNNCEIHGGKHATWYTQGHYENLSNNSYGEMQLLFLNLGDTIYEGLKNDSSKETEDRLNYFLEKHRRYFSEIWDEEMACSVFALQEGISRLRDRRVKGYEGRGTGTVSLLQTLNRIGKCEDGQMPEMTIISGRTYIKFDGYYSMKREPFKNDPAFGNGKKSIIAFNKDNNIYTPADSKYVLKLKENFPGTVISLRIYLDNRYICKEKGDV